MINLFQRLTLLSTFLIACIILPAPTLAQDDGAENGNGEAGFLEKWGDDIAAAKGLDDKIDAGFSPIAQAWEDIVLLGPTLSLNGQDYKIPVVLALLVFGASFFTLYFVFVNIRRFWLAINVVRGKYDEIERAADENVDSTNVNVVDGDVVDTIRDESDHGEVSHFQALATAVSGTVGLGNIGGVAVAIATGGPGATFWMIICGLLGMSTKFVECTLGVAYRDIGPDGTVYGGPMYYLKKGLAAIGLAPLGKVLSVVFAVLCVGASFGGGNAFQSNQATAQIMTSFVTPSADVANAANAAGQNVDAETGGYVKATIGAVFAIIVGLVIIGGIKRIANVTEKIVPAMAGIYVLACLIVIGANIDMLGTALSQIVGEAFTPRAGLGGLLGVLLVGFQRAAFSNEAGAGSAAIAHSAVRTKYPASEGLVALLEPFIDTVVICTMTALVIIFFNLSNADIQGTALEFNTEEARTTALATLDNDTINEGQVFVYGLKDDKSKSLFKNGTGGMGGVDLTSAAFAEVISWFPYVLTVAVVLFALSTMISWSYYGLQSWKFLFGKSQASDLSYKLLFLIFIVIGSSAKLDAVIKFSDAMILALVFPNMIGLFLLASHVKKEMNRYLEAIGVRRFFK